MNLNGFCTPTLYATLQAFPALLQGHMQPLIPSLAAALLYAGATLYQGVRLKQKATPNKALLTLLGVLALLAHSISLTLLMASDQGLRLEFFSSASLVAAAVIGFTLLVSVRLPIQSLWLLLFPLGCLTSLMPMAIPSGTVRPIVEAPGVLAHILLSITAYGLLTIAMLQSLLVLAQDRQLKRKKHSALTRNFPPLQTMESLLFGFLWAGWILLSLSLLSGWMSFDDLFAQHLVHKTLLAVLAWLVFAVLLWGRHQLGWRGYKAIRWTLAGFLLLMLAYFGSKLVREFILHI